jgi:hypothetical protein
MRNKVIGPLLSEDQTVTVDTFLAMMENNALRHVPARTVLQLHGVQPHFSSRVGAFLGQEVS